MIVVQARIHAVASGREAVTRAISDLAREATQNDGCVEYVAGELLGEPGEFLVVGTWSDEPTMHAHYNGAAYGRYATEVTPFLARPTDTVVRTVDETARPVDDPSAEPLRQGY
jgi:quinol monooxygenase YgiN